VTLAAGAVGSPAILLRSGIGPAADLRALGIAPLVDAPGVGANLIDHPYAFVPLLPQPGAAGAGLPQLQVLLRTTAPGSADFNDLQLFPNNQLDLAPLNPEAAAALGVPRIMAVVASLQRPRSRGRLALASADPQVQPRIELNFLADDEDLRRLVEGARLCWRVATAPEVQPFVAQAALFTEDVVASDEGLRGLVRAIADTTFHPVGTARMGPAGDPGAVVDQHCRVRGVDGLRVVDASVMPDIPRANTNLTCIMIGERVAEWMTTEP
jgi:choline dehydrogenase